MNNLCTVIDVNDSGSIIHQVISIDKSDPLNIKYTLIGTIKGYPDKYFVCAVLDLELNKLFFALSSSSYNSYVDNVDLYSVTYPDLLTITPFCQNNTVDIFFNPQITYNPANKLFYYSKNYDPNGFRL